MGFAAGALSVDCGAGEHEAVGDALEASTEAGAGAEPEPTAEDMADGDQAAGDKGADVDEAAGAGAGDEAGAIAMPSPFPDPDCTFCVP